MSSLSNRGLRFMKFVTNLGVVECKYHANPFSEINHEGIINLGTSENRLMFDVLSEKFNDPSSHEIQERYTNYSDIRGYESFRTVVAKFLNHYMKPFEPIQSNDLFAINGCGSCVELLGMTLADPGDGFLIPAPYYGGFIRDLTLRPGIQLVPVNLTSEITAKDQTSPFELTVDLLEKAYDEATQKDIKVRALLLVNPNNPLGYIYSEKQIRDFLQFAHRHGIHVILDELYMLSIFQQGCTMKCVLSYDDIPDPERLHVLWGLSKDFCVSGFRCGILHTVNKEVKGAIDQIAEFHSVSPLVQHIFTNILSDFDWVNDVYIPTSHKRLRENYSVISKTLQKCDIPFIEAVAGLYVWVDFREFLKHKTHDDEMRVFDIFMDNKLYLIPGATSFASEEPGWFRIVFSQKPHVLKLAMERLSKGIAACRKEIKN